MGVWMLPQLLNIINNSSTAWTWATLATMTPLKTLWAPWNLICNVPPKTDKPDHHLFSRTLAGNELAWHQLSATRDWKLQVFSPTPPWKCLVASQLNQDGCFKACYFAAPLGGAKVHVLYLLHQFSQVASFPKWLCWSGTPYEAAGLAIAPVEWSRHPSLRLECGLWDTALKIAGQTWPSYKVEGMLCWAGLSLAPLILSHLRLSLTCAYHVSLAPQVLSHLRLVDWCGFTHVHTCNVTRVQSATDWTASVHTLHMSTPVM